MPLTSDQRSLLARQLAIATLAGLNLRQAALLLLEVVEDYRRMPGDGAVVTSDGVRWFEQRMDAVADAIWRTVQRPDLIVRPWRDVVPLPEQNSQGWWGIPSLVATCSPLTQHTPNWVRHS